MVNQKYLKLQREIENLNEKLNDLMNDLPSCNDSVTFEEECIHSALYRLQDKLNDAVGDMKLYSKNTIEGLLHLRRDKRYEIVARGVDEEYFTCGSYIECFINNEWYAGRVEHNGTNYCFSKKSMGNPELYEGMKVRIRK